MPIAFKIPNATTACGESLIAAIHCPNVCYTDTDCSHAFGQGASVMPDHTDHTLPQANSPLHRALRAELETTRRAFHALLASLMPQDWERPSHNPVWTIGEVLWHITSYLFVIPQQLIWLQTNTFPDPFSESADELNAGNEQQAREDARGQTLSSIAQTYEAGHAATLAALDSVGDDEWQLGVRLPDMGPTFTGEYRTIEALFRYHGRHFAEHAAQIPTAKDNPPS
jgi:uncharacterized damage-inducible protein DinB